MKILLFNLGSVEKRIIAFDIKGYASLFEHDIILWGPIPNSNFTFENKEIPIISFFEPVSIGHVFDRLPDGWIPDIVACDTSVLNYITDIYLCPVKTIIFTRDAWADTIFNRKLVELFDFVPYGVIDRSAYQSYQIKILPLTGFAVSFPSESIDSIQFEKREIDVIAIANYDSGFYHERYKILYKLSGLNPHELNVKIAIGLKRSEIHSHYQNSKIVVDWAHTLSNRSFEAALNGCLLFSHEDNVLMKEFWVPFGEYVPYNENNLVELINYYIDNPNESIKIIERAHDKIRNIPATYGQHTMDSINQALSININVQNRIDRCRSLPSGEMYFRLSTPFLYNYKFHKNFPANWRELYFERVDLAILYSPPGNLKIAALIEAARMSFLLEKHELSLKYLQDLIQVLPDYAWAYYMRGRILFQQNQLSSSIISVQNAVDCAKKAPELLQQYILPVIENANMCDGRRITDYLWQPVYGHNNEFQVIACLHLSCELLGDIYKLQNEKQKALKAYSESISYIAIPSCIYKVSNLLIESDNPETLHELTKKGLEDSPYDSILRLFNAYAILRSGNKRDAIYSLKNHRASLQCFTGNCRLLFTAKALGILIIFIAISKTLGRYIIIRLLNILTKSKNELS